MKILGIDPGYGRLGLVVVSVLIVVGVLAWRVRPKEYRGGMYEQAQVSGVYDKCFFDFECGGVFPKPEATCRRPMNKSFIESYDERFPRPKYGVVPLIECYAQTPKCEHFRCTLVPKGR